MERAAAVALVLLLVPVPMCLLVAILRGYSITVHMSRHKSDDE